MGSAGSVSGFLVWLGTAFQTCEDDLTQSHTHKHVGTVGLETKHSKTSVNHLMITAAFFCFTSFSHYKEFMLLKRLQVVQRRPSGRTCPLFLTLSFFLLLVSSFFRVSSYKSPSWSSAGFPTHQPSAHQPS